MPEKYPYSELFSSIVFRIWTEYEEILRIYAYSVRMLENTDQKRLNTDTFYVVLGTIGLSLNKRTQLRRMLRSCKSCFVPFIWELRAMNLNSVAWCFCWLYLHVRAIRCYILTLSLRNAHIRGFPDIFSFRYFSASSSYFQTLRAGSLNFGLNST